MVRYAEDDDQSDSRRRQTTIEQQTMNRRPYTRRRPHPPTRAAARVTLRVPFAEACRAGRLPAGRGPAGSESGRVCGPSRAAGPVPALCLSCLRGWFSRVGCCPSRLVVVSAPVGRACRPARLAPGSWPGCRALGPRPPQGPSGRAVAVVPAGSGRAGPRGWPLFGACPGGAFRPSVLGAVVGRAPALRCRRPGSPAVPSLPAGPRGPSRPALVVLVGPGPGPWGPRGVAPALGPAPGPTSGGGGVGLGSSLPARLSARVWGAGAVRRPYGRCPAIYFGSMYRRFPVPGL